MKSLPESMHLAASYYDAECVSYLRGGRRYKTQRMIAICQLSQTAKSSSALVRDISCTGMSIQPSMRFVVGDRLRVDFGGFNVLAEVVRCTSESGRLRVGLKLAQSLTGEQLNIFLDRRR